MLKNFIAIRFIVTVIVAFMVINAIAFIGLGAYLSVDGIIGLLKGHLHTEEHPGLKIVESLDIFLVALVFLIFSVGIAKLFRPKSDEKLTGMIPSWLNIHNFTELKMVLWEAILTTLVVFFVSDVVKKEGHFEWTMLIIPASIILLSLSMLILKKAEDEGDHSE